MIPSSAVRRENAALKQEIERAIGAVIDSGEIILSSRVQGFEEEWAAAAGARHCIGVASGLDALEAALRAVGVKSGDRVLIPALSAAATVLAPLRLGAVPVFVDVDERTALMSLDALRDATAIGASAAIPVALYGLRPATALLDFIERHLGCFVVMDMAQAHGSLNESGTPHVRADAAAWSFYPTKNLGALGDAGSVTTDSAEVSTRIRRWRNYGQSQRYEHVEVGANSRLDELQAAVLSVKLTRLEEWTERRREIGTRYLRCLDSSRLTPMLSLDDVPFHALHQFVVRSKERQQFQAFMSSRGVSTDIHYPRALDEQPPFAGLSMLDGHNTASALAAEVVSIPVHPFLTDEDVDIVSQALTDWCSQ